MASLFTSAIDAASSSCDFKRLILLSSLWIPQWDLTYPKLSKFLCASFNLAPSQPAHAIMDPRVKLVNDGFRTLSCTLLISIWRCVDGFALWSLSLFLFLNWIMWSSSASPFIPAGFSMKVCSPWVILLACSLAASTSAWLVLMALLASLISSSVGAPLSKCSEYSFAS